MDAIHYVPLVKEDYKGRKYAESHHITDLDKRIYRELQWHNEFVPTEEVLRKFPDSSTKHSLRRLSKLGYITVLSIAGEELAIAN